MARGAAIRAGPRAAAESQRAGELHQSSGAGCRYSNQRQIELLVEAGFTPLEAISIGTLNGAKYLGRDAHVGSIAVGKQADLVVVAGDPSASIADIRRIDTVFRNGVGYDPDKLVASVSGHVGIW